MKSKIFVLSLIAFAFSFTTKAQQGVKISANAGSSPAPSAILEVESANKGVLFPKVALSSISSPAPIGNPIEEGLMVYNTVDNAELDKGYYFWNSSSWIPMWGGGIPVMTHQSMMAISNPYIGQVIMVEDGVDSGYNGLWYYGGDDCHGPASDFQGYYDEYWYKIETDFKFYLESGRNDLLHNGCELDPSLGGLIMKGFGATISQPLETIKGLETHSFLYDKEKDPQNLISKKSDGTQYGLILSEVEKTLPGAVTNEDGYKNVNYDVIVSVLLEGMKKQQEQIEELKAILEEMNK